MQSVKIIAKYRIKEGKTDAFTALFAKMAKLTALETGNLVYRSFSDKTNGQNFFIYEEYTNMEALEAHRNSHYFKEILMEGILPLLDNREVYQLTEHNF